ncbi:hypothetical protein M9H77_29880 [Catharanthus roseus]|uniref:Uncharacterized protein n=1 Tax=Catharanthus roseus TaxID=4058 RepID=A0ACB9ZVP0_CATRO|nr:hypothetical protein M9H77_29880 [Catharanthus roseus]
MIYGDQKAAQEYYFSTVQEVEMEEESMEDNKMPKLEPDGEYESFVLDQLKPEKMGYSSGYNHVFGSVRALHCTCLVPRTKASSNGVDILNSGEWIQLKRGVDRGGCVPIILRGHRIMLCSGVRLPSGEPAQNRSWSQGRPDFPTALETLMSENPRSTKGPDTWTLNTDGSNGEHTKGVEFTLEDPEGHHDSQVVIGQLTGIFEAKEENMKQYLAYAQQLIFELVCVDFEKVTREQNIKADMLLKLSAEELIEGTWIESL